ncbi:hypothetical protein ACI3PL_24120, partial [Lacticaseibacillus paracasei]
SGMYWDSGSEFAHGPGFKAWAADFPEGTRLIVTVRIETPNAELCGGTSATNAQLDKDKT